MSYADGGLVCVEGLEPPISWSQTRAVSRYRNTQMNWRARRGSNPPATGRQPVALPECDVRKRLGSDRAYNPGEVSNVYLAAFPNALWAYIGTANACCTPRDWYPDTDSNRDLAG